MELLPIIYLSLLIVGILAIIVIIFSFVSFQVRKKLGNLPNEKVSSNERNKKVKVTNPDISSSKDKKHHPKVQTLSKQKSNSYSEKEKKIAAEDSGHYKKPTKETPKKRVVILNENFEDEYYDKESSSKNPKYHQIKIESKKDGWN